MEPSRLERAVLEWVATREPTLELALASPVVQRRDYTGAGFYTYLEGAPADGDRGMVDGPQIQSPQLEHGGGSILWLKSGQPDCLELYANGANFPERIETFTLRDFE